MQALCVAYGGARIVMIIMRWKRRSAWSSDAPAENAGVKWVQAYKGDAFWEAHHAEVWSRRPLRGSLKPAAIRWRRRDRGSMTFSHP